ncbi:dynamin-1-like protein [Macrosteles quadrilineatus]|uniref:dynamin-1-like protein n=1 Tax=Macrosteles quadrilineatus TaxID=74068 RepID=UPI0023E0EA76|nr:dynamin-1-like protein [Macrosteles quadrilineatus]
MNELVEIINQLQDVFLISGQVVDLPQVVVIGSQSAGKSSVLEHLVGKSFLPRGVGVVTRCPLVLQLVHSSNDVLDEYAIFQHDQTKVFTDFKLISNEIKKQTVKLAGSNKGICHLPITLKIYSKSYLNLTLVDLPGLTKIPVGDQPDDIEKQTRDIVLEYIRNPNSIILAVTPANADLTTSESLALARDVDPEGERTLAVITKLDLMDEGTDAWDILSGKIIPVKLGIIGVVNRSQRDIMENKSMKKALKEEAEFFHNHYRAVERNHGTPYLTKTVQRILTEHIKSCLPKLKENVKEKLSKKQEELKAMGDMSLDKPSLLIDIVSKFSKTYCSIIRGDTENIQTTELSGGARINRVFQALAQALRTIDALSGLSKGAILTATQNASGASPGLFVPEVTFELLMKRQIQRFRSPCLRCVDLVNEELCRIVQTCAYDPLIGLERYPTLQKEVIRVVTELLRSRLPIANKIVDNFIDVQLAYINTRHPNFITNCVRGKEPKAYKQDKCVCITLHPAIKLSEKSLTKVTESSRKKEESSKETRDYQLINKLIQSYFSIVQITVQDTVPKIIMHSIVNFVMERLHCELISQLYNGNTYNLMKESQDFVEKRQELVTTVAQLEKAYGILNYIKPSTKSNCKDALTTTLPEEAEFCMTDSGHSLTHVSRQKTVYSRCASVSQPIVSTPLQAVIWSVVGEGGQRGGRCTAESEAGDLHGGYCAERPPPGKRKESLSRRAAILSPAEEDEVLTDEALPIAALVQ